jgi:hypothetical protein
LAYFSIIAIEAKRGKNKKPARKYSGGIPTRRGEF